MRLDESEGLARLTSHDHGVLCTLHAERGVDAVPVVYAVDDDRHLAVPVDRVKPKTSSRLQRQRNLEADPRATLLIEQWDRDDWSRLWWVRAELAWIPGQSVETPLGGELAGRLAERYPQYADRPFHGLLVFHITAVTGWAASGAEAEG